jgi:DNA (cytosine-5)-methyltransferase 1
MFEGALSIVKDKSQIEACLWPEEDYFELNVIYKASKNLPKMRKALDKHKGKLLRIAEGYLKLSDDTHINREAKRAFRAILNYYNGTLAVELIKAEIESSIMIQRMLSKSLEIFKNNILVDEYVCSDGLTARIRSFAVYDYLEKILTAPENDYVICSDVLCAADYGAPQKRMRFVVMGIKRSIASKIALPNGRFDADEYRTVRDAISDLEDVKPVVDLEDDKEGIQLEAKENLGELAMNLRNAKVLRNHMITKTTATAMERFKALKQGQNFHALDDSLKTNTYTDAARTQNTIYLRLNYDEPSGTVVNVRKSMWIHPTLDRAISVREAARLQTFPDSFVFCGSKDKQYQQVGNAVPPIMAKSIAKKLAQTLTKNLFPVESNEG